MRNKTLIIASVLIIGGIFCVAYFIPKSPKISIGAASPLDATYLIDEKPVTLVNGKAEIEIAPGAESKQKVSLFGEPAYGDIDGDGDQDAVLLLVSNSGGSGTFYYAAMADNFNRLYRGTDSILLGDRIAPQTYYIQGNKAIVNYAVRPAGAPMTARNSEGESLYLQIDPKTFRLILIAPNFEGEADPSRMTLDMTRWKWINTIYNNDTMVTPKKPGVFTLTFKKDGTFSVTTDCNSMSGGYKTNGSTITFTNIATTLMFCEGSQEQDFSAMLGKIQSYHFTSKGELIFDLKLDTGSMVFR